MTRQQIQSASGSPDPKLYSIPEQARSDALGRLQGQDRQATSLTDKKSATNTWSVQEDLSEHVSWFRRHGNMNLDTFKLNCKNRKVSPEAMKSALKEDGVIFTETGVMV